MSRPNRWRAFGLTVGCLAVVMSYSAWTGHRSSQTDFAYQQRLSSWGGRSQPLPKVDNLLFPFRKAMGDLFYLNVVGSEGRVVGAHRPGATGEQLADLLSVQPICTAYVCGTAVDDRWVSGIRDRRSMMGLFLDGTAVTDRSVETILEMAKLEQLGLADTAISDESIARLVKLPSLGRLTVGGPNVRAIRLVDHAVVDAGSQPASRSGEPVSVRGRVAISAGLGLPSNVRVMARAPGDPPARDSVPYGWNAGRDEVGSLSEDSAGVWSFDVPLAGLPTGKSIVEVWVEFVSQGGAKLVHYRLETFAIELTATPDRAADQIKP